jgi:hypothetical protein
MRFNTAAALLLLLLGAALGDWLSSHDASAQGLPPSSGGSSYTLPSAISLSNGINSADGGTFTGPVIIKDYAGNNGRTLYTDANTGRLVADYLSVSNSLIATNSSGFIQCQANSGQTCFSQYTAGARFCLESTCTDYFSSNGSNLVLTGLGLEIPSGEALRNLGSDFVNQASIMRSSANSNTGMEIRGSTLDSAGNTSVTLTGSADYASADLVHVRRNTSGGAKVAKVDRDGQVFSGFGTSSSNSAAVFAGGTLSVNTTTVGNVGAGEDDLITYSLPADSLVVSGRGVRITAWGTTANNANAKTLKVYFGGTALISHSLPNGTLPWRFEVLVFRTGASAQAYNATFTHNGSSTQTEVKGGTLAVTETAAITIKTTGEATADNDITSNGLFVEAL